MGSFWNIICLLLFTGNGVLFNKFAFFLPKIIQFFADTISGTLLKGKCINEKTI